MVEPTKISLLNPQSEILQAIRELKEKNDLLKARIVSLEARAK